MFFVASCCLDVSSGAFGLGVAQYAIFRKNERDARAFSKRTVERHAAAMQLGQTAHDRQSEAGPLVLVDDVVTALPECSNTRS